MTDSGRTFRARDNHRLHRIWGHIIERCEKPTSKAYQRYGGRGITVCKEWRDNFQAFCKWSWENGYDPTLDWRECTIDRIDNNAGYSPDNCRWISVKEQARNRRGNKLVTFNGETHILTDWADIVGMKKSTLRKRFELGWSVEDALTRPIRKDKSSRYRNKAV